MKFSLSNLFLCIACLSVGLGWIADRQFMIAKQRAAANAYDRKVSALIGWAHAEPAARTELAWRGLRNLPPEEQLEKITKRTQGSVFWLVQLACEIEPQLDDVFGRHGFTVEQVSQFLAEYDSKLLTVADIRREIADSYDSEEDGFKEMFPALFAQGSSEFVRLDDFLNRVCIGTKNLEKNSD